MITDEFFEDEEIKSGIIGFAIGDALEKGFDIGRTTMQSLAKIDRRIAFEIMKKYHVPDWYIDSWEKIMYLFPKAHGIAYSIMNYQLTWFKLYYPKKFYKSLEK